MKARPNRQTPRIVWVGRTESSGVTIYQVIPLGASGGPCPPTWLFHRAWRGQGEWCGGPDPLHVCHMTGTTPRTLKILCCIMPLFAWAVGLSGCGSSDEASETSRPSDFGFQKSVRASLLDEGRNAYAAYCVGCHGEKGEGEAAVFLDSNRYDRTRILRHDPPPRPRGKRLAGPALCGWPGFSVTGPARSKRIA